MEERREEGERGERSDSEEDSSSNPPLQDQSIIEIMFSGLTQTSSDLACVCGCVCGCVGVCVCVGVCACAFKTTNLTLK